MGLKAYQLGELIGIFFLHASTAMPMWSRFGARLNGGVRGEVWDVGQMLVPVPDRSRGGAARCKKCMARTCRQRRYPGCARQPG